VSFRDQLIATLRAISAVLEEPGVLVVGSEVPNLLETGAASTLVVSQDVDIGVPLSAHAAVKARLSQLTAFNQSPEEPSVLIPTEPALIEVNFLGIDAAAEIGDAYVLEDDQLPLMVFGALRLLHAGEPLALEGLRIPLPRPAGLILEKLLTDRTGEKGDRDLLVALGLLLVSGEADLAELETDYAKLPADLRHGVRSNLTLLSLVEPRPQMPDPEPERARVARLLGRLEAVEEPGS
jgi:hypothetical protein